MITTNIRPTFSEFKRLARRHNLIPLSVDIMADYLTPVSLLSSRWETSPHCFLLESVEGGEKLGRYSVLSFEPDAVLQEQDGRSSFMAMDGGSFVTYEESALDALRRYMKCIKPAPIPGLPRFFGGAVGYCSYEMVHSLERLPKKNPDPVGWPPAAFLITGNLLIFDNTQQLLKIVSCVRIDKSSNLVKAYADAKKKIVDNVNWIQNAAKTFRKSRLPANSSRYQDFESNMTREAFVKAVESAKEHISRGDIIQVVLSRRMDKRTNASPLDIYRCLRVVNPSPYMYLIKLKDRAIIGSSPESLVRLENGIATTRPIAGTRRRGSNAAEDKILEQELLNDPKEIAEHIMLVDLGRNDLGRVCDAGSVTVPTFMKIERYSHVMHIVSEVTGKLKEGMDGFDLLKATFPAGTVAGAPKIRAMQIIDDLEIHQRGPYAGAVGYFSYSGAMDMAITIRTVLWKDGKVSIQTGAGIVADSVPLEEFKETENKAAAMKETLTLAESGKLFWERS